MGDNKISEAVVRLACDAYDKIAQWGDVVNEFEAMNAALESALPHLQGEAVPVAVACVPANVRSAISSLANIANGDFPSLTATNVAVIDEWINAHLQPAELSEVSGDSGELGAEEVTLKQVINGYAVFYGSLRQAAELMCIDPAYLSRLAGGSKTNPSDEVLEKLGLERRVVYTRKVRDYQPTKLHPRTKCA